MKRMKLIILTLLVLSLFVITGCAPKATMSKLMKEDGYSQDNTDPFDRATMVNVRVIDHNYGKIATLEPKPGAFKKYANKILVRPLKGKSYFSTLEEYKEAGKPIHALVKKHLSESRITLTENQSLYHYNLKSFEFDRDLVTGDIRDIMKEVLVDVKKHGVTPLILVGFADEIGTEKYNIVLSEKRAQALKIEFEKLGLDTAKLKILAGGETTAYGSHPENRMGELVCIGPRQ